MAGVVESPRSRNAVAGVLLLGCAVAVALGVYGRVHDPGAKPLFVDFASVLAFKTWFATAAFAFVLVQLATALWMWGRLPGAGDAPAWVAPAHRWSGAIAFVLLVPVVLNCLYTLGFATYTARTTIHSIAGCVFYGAYAAKMLGLRLRGLPGWGLPVLGGLVFASFVAVWSTSAVWFFTESGKAIF